MTVDLARRLFASGAVPARLVEAALLDAAGGRQSFVRALFERGSRFARAIERELSRTPIAIVREPPILRAVVKRLPPLLCERLLVVPFRVDPSTGTVDVACVDPGDPHVGSELAHHLGTSVRLHRAAFADIAAALDRVRGEPAPEPDPPVRQVAHTPAFGTQVERPSAPPAARWSMPPKERGGFKQSEPPPRALADDEPAPASSPIPLVRRAPEERRFRVGTNPGVGQGRHPAEVVVHERDEAGEPVLGLFRSKPPPPPAPTPTEMALLGSSEERMAAALESIAAARTPKDVVGALVEGATLAAQRVVALAVRGGSFVGRTASAKVPGRERVRRLSIPGDIASAPATAVRIGHYLGRLPADAIHAPLRGLLGNDEAYLVSVSVSGRPAMILALCGLTGSYEATRAADRLAQHAGEQLEAILRAQKKS